MDKFDRIYALHPILSGRSTPIALADLIERLECSRPTFFRRVETLRDRLHAPIDGSQAHLAEEGA